MPLILPGSTTSQLIVAAQPAASGISKLDTRFQAMLTARWAAALVSTSVLYRHASQRIKSLATGVASVTRVSGSRLQTDLR